MNPNEKLIHDFYTSFQNKDYRAMQAYYADNAIFNDSVFKNLNASEVKAMWQMLISKGKDLQLEFSNIIAEGNLVKAHWDASYTFSATGRKVVNRIDAIFEIEDGKIAKHTDHFDFYTWSKQALGLTGLLLGWTSFLNKKISSKAKQNLLDYMRKS